MEPSPRSSATNSIWRSHHKSVNGLSPSGERRPARRRPFLRKREKNLPARHNPVGRRFQRSADPAAPAFPWLVRVGRSCTAPEMLSLPFAIDDQASVRMNCRPSPPYRASAIHRRLNGLRRTPSHANRSRPEIWPAARHGRHDRFHYAGSPGAGSVDVEARSGPKLALEPQQGRIVMKTSCTSCVRRASVRCPSPPNIRRPAAGLQRRLSGGETDAASFIRPSYDAAGGASEAKRRGNFTSGTQTGHSRRGLSNNICATDVSPRPYERADARESGLRLKASVAPGVGFIIKLRTCHIRDPGQSAAGNRLLPDRCRLQHRKT